ncbi:BQ5605_C002g01013 [Microbotryum silenes-dioicae]|uniref:BQ5605_C002g01013 protein n=1 Tax=Microbotryum silenes-dioicae TaxID=796604 RepID=A0A2X0LXJ4_9BASI|nr:BQ5605_C002g01013 [Microbotryum silenes-dioicae]
MSLLSDLVHLRTIEVTPEHLNLHNVLSLASTTSDSRRSSRRTNQAQYVYSGPRLRNSPVSALDDVVVKYSLGQLVRSNLNFSMDLLKELCRVRHVEGYSRRNPLAKELFLQALLWQCDPHCNACSNGPRFVLNGMITSPRLRLFCCLVCSERVFGHNVRWVPEVDMKREESGIWKVLTNSTLRTDLRPPTYDFSAWRGALIDPRGLHRPSDLNDRIVYSSTKDALQCSLCPDCFKSLFPTTGPPTKPPRSLSNGFYRALDHVPADVRECFSNASQLEHLVTGRARAYKIVYKLTRFGDPKAQQKFTRGNTLIFSQNTASFTDVLPMSVEELADSVYVLFCEGSPNLTELDKRRPMIVKQNRIQKMLRWLTNESKNPTYSAVSFDGERLAQLVRRSSGALDQTSPASTAVSASSSTSASVPVAPQVSDQQIADGDGLVPDFNQDKPTYVIPTGDTPLWESSDKLLLSKLWPHLDPFGLISFCVERDVKFLWTSKSSIGSICTTAIFDATQKVARIATALLEIDMDVLAEMIKKSKDTKRYKATTEAEKDLNRIMAELPSVGDKIHDTTTQMLDTRNEIR